MTLDVATHKNILVRILKDIYGDAELGPILGFKGGTAAYLFYNLGRFSTDLDFDLLSAQKAEHVFSRLKAILEDYGALKEAVQKRFSLLLVLSYAGKASGATNIKVEVNRRAFGSRYEVKSYLGIAMKAMVKEDMTAHKLVAMFERIGRANRDVFDVWFFLKNNWPINEKIVEARTGVPFKVFLTKATAALEKVPNRNILDGVGELLDEQQKTWAREHLKEETLFLLKLQLER